MAFKLTPDPRFFAAVKITVPGQAEPVELDLEFKYLPSDEYEAWWEARKDSPMRDSLGELVLGWSGVVDDAGKAVEFSVATFGALLNNYPAAGFEILRQYVELNAGSRLKN